MNNADTTPKRRTLRVQLTEALDEIGDLRYQLMILRRGLAMHCGHKSPTKTQRRHHMTEATELSMGDIEHICFLFGLDPDEPIGGRTCEACGAPWPDHRKGCDAMPESGGFRVIE